jgi:hypothetical protein
MVGSSTAVQYKNRWMEEGSESIPQRGITLENIEYEGACDGNGRIITDEESGRRIFLFELDEIAKVDESAIHGNLGPNWPGVHSHRSSSQLSNFFASYGSYCLAPLFDFRRYGLEPLTTGRIFETFWPGTDMAGANIVVHAVPAGESEVPSHLAVRAFTEGLGDVPHKANTVRMANRIAKAALEKTIDPEISVDVDGALSFDLRLANGLLMFVELGVNGTLDAGIIDDEQGTIVERLRNTTAEELIRCF